MFKAIEAARKQAHRGTIMSDITNEVLTAEEIRELREIRERFRNQDLRDEQSELPEDIQLELEASSKIQLKNKLKQYTRETIKLEGGAAQLRKAERRASELYNEIRYIFEEGGDEQTMSTILEKTRRPTVYCLATGTELDRDTKYLSIKELRLPDSLKYLEGTLQRRDIEFTFENNSNSRNQTLFGMTLYIRQPKETQTKTVRLGRLDLESMCSVRTTWLFITKTEHLRSELPEDHSLFLVYLMEPSKLRPLNPISVANIVKKHMQAAGIDTKIYGPHSIRSASSTKATELGNKIDKTKKHANWSLSANVLERFYYKLSHQHADSKKITNSIFSFCPENHNTSEVRLKSTGIGLGTSSNATVDERRTEDVVTQPRWYESFFIYI
ncbi:hypothetical protein RMCBS344292_07357 [Rhizopus microsporus]|nr:hypothetical protein RMCBS344292_07357 [Rhizopus microsporus]